MEQRMSESSHANITVIQALNDKYSEENCTFDESSHILISSKSASRGRES